MRFRRHTAPSERSIIRASVIAGFGLIVVLWAGSAYDFLSSMRVVQNRTNRVHAWYTETETLLDEVRAGVLEASVDLRDALLDTSVRSDDDYRRDVTLARAAVEEALRRYEPYAHSEAERREFVELRHKVSDLWEVTAPILDLDERGEQAEALEALRNQIVPRRQAIHRMSEHITRLNQGAAEDQREEVENLFRMTERRAWLVGGFVLLLSGGVTGVVSRYADRMERQIRRETQKNAENVQALQRLSDRLVRAGEDERRRIARELHDEIGQALTAVKIDLKGVAGWSADHSAQLDGARRAVDAAIENVRTLSRMLHPMVLEDLGLAAAVDWHLQEFGRRCGLEVSFNHAGLEARLPSSVEACLYRTIQEATNNVARHARATRCRVTVEHSAGRVMAIVEDNGRGIDARHGATPGAPRGLGLVGMRERVQGFGGSMYVTGRAGEGTRVRVELPVPGDQAAQPCVLNGSSAVAFSN